MADDLDLEQELLLVAGRNRAGTSSGKRGRGKAASDSDDGSEDNLFGSDSDEERPQGHGKSGSKGKHASKKGRTSASRQDDDDDDNEEDEDGGYGSDLYINDEDREKLSAMNELQREMILAERAEERDKQRQRKALLKNAKDKDNEKSRSATGRLSSRQRKAAADKDSAIRQIQAARKRQSQKGRSKSRRKSGGSAGARDWSESDDEQGSSGDEGEEEFRPSDEESEEGEEQPGSSGQRREDGNLAPATRSADVRDDGDEAGEGEGEDERPGAAVGLRDTRRYEDDDYEDVEKEDASHDELRGIQVLRSQLEGWYDKPFCNGEGMAGVVVRMAYGEVSQGQQYMLFVVHDIKEGGRPYAFGPRQAMCNKYMVVVDGFGTKHTLAMQIVSNSPFQEQELERYHRHCVRAERKPLSKQDVAEAKRKLEAAAGYRWDASKVREVLERKRAAGQQPVNVAAEKGRLWRLLEEAQARGQEEQVASIEQQLREIEARAMMAKPGNQRTYGMSHINKRNMQINFNIAFKNVSNKPAGFSERQGGVDPFSRRTTRPSIYWNTKSEAATAEAVAAEKEAAANRDAVKKSLEAAKLSTRQMKLDPAELIRQLDIAIDMGLLQQPSAPLLTKRLLGRRWQGCLSSVQPDLTDKGILTIEDWKQRAGFMDQQ